MFSAIDRIADTLQSRARTTGCATYTCRDGLEVVFVQVAGQCILTLSMPVGPVAEESIFRWREALGVPHSLKPSVINGTVEFRWPSAGTGSTGLARRHPTCP